MDIQRSEALPVLGGTGGDEYTGTRHVCALQAAKLRLSSSAVQNSPPAELLAPDRQVRFGEIFC